MHIKNYVSFIGKVGIYLGLFGMCHSANAVMINFDELDPEVDSMITTQYESQGLVFEYSAYLSSHSTKSAPNYAIGPGFMLKFVGDLPTYVSFYTGSSTKSKVFITALGPNGFSESLITEGEIHGQGDLESTPYIPNQFIVFKSDFGISTIELGGQSDAYVDDVSFYYAGEAVPEPSTLALVMMGMLGVLWRRLKP